MTRPIITPDMPVTQVVEILRTAPENELFSAAERNVVYRHAGHGNDWRAHYHCAQPFEDSMQMAHKIVEHYAACVTQELTR